MARQERTVDDSGRTASVPWDALADALACLTGPPAPKAGGLQTERTTMVPLAGGEAEPLLARLLAEGRAIGNQACWSYRCEPSDPAATVRRWEVPA